MSFGAIYCQTWWGDFKNVQFSIPNMPDCMLPAIVQNYITRVEADGGIVEGKGCLADAMIDLGYDSINNEVSIILQAYIDRVEAASGIVEAGTCLKNVINDLKNI